MYSKLNTSNTGFDGFCPLEKLRELDIPYIKIDWAQIPIINEKMRAILVDWVTEVSVMFKFSSPTLFLSIKLIDLFLSLYSYEINRDNFQLYGLACLVLAVKEKEITVPELNDYVFTSSDAYTAEQIRSAEILVFETLKGRINYPTLIDYSMMFFESPGFTIKGYHIIKVLGAVSTVDCKLLRFSSEEISVALNWIVSDRLKECDVKRVLTDIPVERIELCIGSLYDVFRRIEKSSLKSSRNYKLKNTGFDSFSNLLKALDLPENAVTWNKYPSETNMLLSLPDVKFEGALELKEIGKGTYGTVFLTKLKNTECAVKISTSDDEGLNPSFIRELNVLIAIHILGKGGVHTVNCVGFAIRKGKEYLFLEKADFSLHSFLEGGNKITDPLEAALELFSALDYLHSIGVMHRDIKPLNILVFKNNEGGYNLKICDFGVSRGAGIVIANGNAFTPDVCTLWYRPPEILLGTKTRNTVLYGPSADVWSMICVVSEIVNGSAPFKGQSVSEMIYEISKKCGFSPNFRQNYEVPKNVFIYDEELCGKLVACPENPNRNWIKAEVPALKEVLERGFESDPLKRITAGEAHELLKSSFNN